MVKPLFYKQLLKPSSPIETSTKTSVLRQLFRRVNTEPMAYLGAGMILSLFLATMMLWDGAMSQANGTECTNVIISMSPCLNYVQGNSTAAPSRGCCTQLQSVATSQPGCLCQVLNGGASSLGLTVDQSQALNLPQACNVQTPPASQCKTATANGLPSGTPGSSSTVPSGGSSVQSSPNSNNSGTISIKGAASLLFFLVFVVSHVSITS